MEYLLISIVLVVSYLFVVEKMKEKKKMPFSDILNKLN